MSAPPHEVLEAARVQAGMSFKELWIAYFSLGGTFPPHALRTYLGGRAPSSVDYDVLAQALNDRFVDLGQNHPVPYRDELP